MNPLIIILSFLTGCMRDGQTGGGILVLVMGIALSWWQWQLMNENSACSKAFEDAYLTEKIEGKTARFFRKAWAIGILLASIIQLIA